MNTKALILTCLAAATLALSLSGCKADTAEPGEASAAILSKGVPSKYASDLVTNISEIVQSGGDDVQNGAEGMIDDGGSQYGLPLLLDVREKDDGNRLVLVNKHHGTSPDYYPTDMVPVDGSLSTNQGLYFKREAYEAYLEMLSDAKKEGLSFLICSTYRSYDNQNALYHGYISSHGLEDTNTFSAYPGRSEHHTGWAVDITYAAIGYGVTNDFADHPEGQWIGEHCSEYGFILRYPKDKTDITGYAYEPWHFRYVGRDVAREITERGITFEEYLGRL